MLADPLGDHHRRGLARLPLTDIPEPKPEPKVTKSKGGRPRKDPRITNSRITPSGKRPELKTRKKKDGSAWSKTGPKPKIRLSDGEMDIAARLKVNPEGRAIHAPMGEKFVKTLFADARHKALFGGRGGGKSWAVATYLLIKAIEAQKRIICCRQFQSSIRDSSKELVEKRLHALGLWDQFSITDRSITNKATKADFLFMGLERNIDSIRSLEGADIVWIEEARTINAKSMEILLPTIRKPGSELIWTWNPELATDPVDAYFRFSEPPPRSIVTFVDYRDNPFFKDTELVHEMETLKVGNFERYRHVWLGEYDAKHDSKVFSHARTWRAVMPETVPARYGLDFGFGSDPSVITKTYINEDRKQVYVAKEAFGRVSMDELPALVRSVIDSDRDLIKADSSQPGTIEFLRRRGLNVHAAQKGPGSIKSGINFLQSYDIMIDPSCEGMREEARLYSWMTDRKTGEILNVPVDANNHGWDSVRYALEDFALEGEDPAMDPQGGVIQLFRNWR